VAFFDYNSIRADSHGIVSTQASGGGDLAANVINLNGYNDQAEVSGFANLVESHHLMGTATLDPTVITQTAPPGSGCCKTTAVSSRP
jgi:hypothetical protein